MSDKETMAKKVDDEKLKQQSVLADAANRLLTDEKLMKKIGDEVTLFTRDVLSDETVINSAEEILREG
ncbi:hypothetical protein MKW92_052564, partial [Papaver armeniacum]